MKVRQRHLHWASPPPCRAIVTALGIAAALAVAVSAQASEAEGRAFVQSQLGRLNQLLVLGEASDETLDRGIAGFLDGAVDLEHSARITFGDYTSRTLKDGEGYFDDEKRQKRRIQHRQELEQLYLDRLAADLVAFIRTHELSRLDFVSFEATANTKGTAVVRAVSVRGPVEMRCHLRRHAGEWRLVDASMDDRPVSRQYRSLVRDVLKKKLSLPVLAARLRGQTHVVLEDFATTSPGQLPKGWGWRPRDKDDEKLYEVREKNGRHYLAAQDSGQDVIMMKPSHWNPRDYPIMTWCWRANALPPGGNERLDHMNDSAAGLYVFFSQNWLGIPKTIKYVWSTTLTDGTVGRRNRIGRPYFFVVESGDKSLATWTFEMVDLEADYRRVYGEKPKTRSRGIGILTDANSTRSYAEAYYADVRVWPRRALESGQIADYCSCIDSTAGERTSETTSLPEVAQP